MTPRTYNVYAFEGAMWEKSICFGFAALNAAVTKFVNISTAVKYY